MELRLHDGPAMYMPEEFLRHQKEKGNEQSNKLSQLLGHIMQMGTHRRRTYTQCFGYFIVRQSLYAAHFEYAPALLWHTFERYPDYQRHFAGQKVLVGRMFDIRFALHPEIDIFIDHIFVFQMVKGGRFGHCIKVRAEISLGVDLCTVLPHFREQLLTHLFRIGVIVQQHAEKGLHRLETPEIYAVESFVVAIAQIGKHGGRQVVIKIHSFRFNRLSIQKRLHILFQKIQNRPKYFILNT